MTLTVFISYGKEDKAPAMKLYFELLGPGVQPWIESISLLPGQLWEKEIREAISHSSYFIALLSSRSVTKRGYVQKELRHAIEIADEYPEDKIFIIPARLDECRPSFERLNKLHRVDLFPDYEAGLNDLLRVFRYETEEKPNLRHVETFARVGEIKNLATRGFGFISSFPIRQDIFFHHTELRGVSFDELRAGDMITFNLASGRTDLAAQNVERA